VPGDVLGSGGFADQTCKDASFREGSNACAEAFPPDFRGDLVDVGRNGEAPLRQIAKDCGVFAGGSDRAVHHL
jgi:hypothetical protein